MNIHIDLPENVLFILEKFEEYGSIGYVVGGCVRDSILGKVPNDWDICTPLLPNVVKSIFKDFHTVDTGIKHGTVTVIINDDSYEITTYRIDGIYSDGRHPDDVNYTDRLLDDLMRRDFTINAMAYNPSTGLVDKFGGLSDLKYGIIRCVGSPYCRFKEDGLRILRAMRFASVLGFTIENDTAEAMDRYRCMIDNVSKERIMTEIVKMLSSSNPHSLARILRLHELIILHIFPCVNNAIDLSLGNDEIADCWDQTICIIRNTPNDEIVRLSALFSDVTSVENTEEILKESRFDNATVKCVTQLINRHELYHSLTGDFEKDGYLMRVILHEIGVEQAFRLVFLWRSNVKAKTNIGKYNRLRDIEFAENMIVKAIHEKQCFTLKELDISGDDLIEIGFKPGKDVGDTLNKLLQEVLKEPFKNKKNWLLNWARKELENASDEQMD